MGSHGKHSRSAVGYSPGCLCPCGWLLNAAPLGHAAWLLVAMWHRLAPGHLLSRSWLEAAAAAAPITSSKLQRSLPLPSELPPGCGLTLSGLSGRRLFSRRVAGGLRFGACVLKTGLMWTLKASGFWLKAAHTQLVNVNVPFKGNHPAQEQL